MSAAFPDRLPTSRVPDPYEAPSLRWGVVGTGWIADRFVSALLRFTGQRVVAVAARNADKAAAFAATYGIDRAHASTEALLADAAVDVVYVATTHPAHLPVALQSLGAGKPTVVEKPLGINAGEARQIAAAAERAGVFCMEALWTLFLPKFDVIRQVLESGMLGEIGSVLADHGEWFPDDHRIFDAAQAGGPMLDLGTYPVSFATWVLGAPAAVVAAGRDRADGLNLSASALLTAPTGASAVLHTTMAANTPTRASVGGSASHLDIPGPFYQPGGFTVHSADLRHTLVHSEPAIAHDALYFEAVEAARCIADGRLESPLRPPADSIAMLDVMDEIRRRLGIRYPTEGSDLAG